MNKKNSIKIDCRILAYLKSLWDDRTPTIYKTINKSNSMKRKALTNSSNSDRIWYIFLFISNLDNIWYISYCHQDDNYHKLILELALNNYLGILHMVMVSKLATFYIAYLNKVYS